MADKYVTDDRFIKLAARMKAQYESIHEMTLRHQKILKVLKERENRISDLLDGHDRSIDDIAESINDVTNMVADKFTQTDNQLAKHSRALGLQN